MPLDFLSELLIAISGSTYPDTAAHLLTVYLEDLGSTRADRASVRRQVARGTPFVEALRRSDLDIAEHDLDPDAQGRWGPLKPPSPGYVVCGLLPLGPALDSEEAAERMTAVKSCLMVLVPDLCPSDDASWQWVDELDHDAWIEGLKRSMSLEAVDDTVAFVMDYVGVRAGDENSQANGDADMDGRSEASRSILGSTGAGATRKDRGGQASLTVPEPGQNDKDEEEVFKTPMESPTPAGGPSVTPLAYGWGASLFLGHGLLRNDEIGEEPIEEGEAEPDSLEGILGSTAHRVIPLG